MGCLQARLQSGNQGTVTQLLEQGPVSDLRIASASQHLVITIAQMLA